MARLKPPVNVRDTNQNCCANCKYLGTFEVTVGSTVGDDRVDNEWLCKRANEPVCDPCQIETTVCDGYKRRTYD